MSKIPQISVFDRLYTTASRIKLNNNYQSYLAKKYLLDKERQLSERDTFKKSV